MSPAVQSGAGRRMSASFVHQGKRSYRYPTGCASFRCTRYETRRPAPQRGGPSTTRVTRLTPRDTVGLVPEGHPHPHANRERARQIARRERVGDEPFRPPDETATAGGETCADTATEAELRVGARGAELHHVQTDTTGEIRSAQQPARTAAPLELVQRVDAGSERDVRIAAGQLAVVRERHAHFEI